MEVLACDVHTQEITRIRVEAVSVGAPAPACAYLTLFLDVPFLDEFRDLFGCGGDADAQCLAEIGNTAGPFCDAEPDYFPLSFGHTVIYIRVAQNYKNFFIFVFVFVKN